MEIDHRSVPELSVDEEDGNTDPALVPPRGSSLYYGDELVWSNPPGLGHIGIKMMKQGAEEVIIAKMEARRAAMSPEELDDHWRKIGEKFGFTPTPTTKEPTASDE